MIPFKYSCDGANVNPPLNIEYIPEATKSLAVICENIDAHPVHGALGMEYTGNEIIIKEYGMHGVEGMNDFHQQRYIDPVPSFDTHRYAFKMYKFYRYFIYRRILLKQYWKKR